MALEMELNVGTNIVCGAVSDDGRWLAVSDGLEVKLFRLGELVSPIRSFILNVPSSSLPFI